MKLTETPTRLVDLDGLCRYFGGVGKSTGLKIAKESGSARKIGRLTRYDLKILSEYADGLPTGESARIQKAGPTQ